MFVCCPFDRLGRSLFHRVPHWGGKVGGESRIHGLWRGIGLAVPGEVRRPFLNQKFSEPKMEQNQLIPTQFESLNQHMFAISPVYCDLGKLMWAWLVDDLHCARGARLIKLQCDSDGTFFRGFLGELLAMGCSQRCEPLKTKALILEAPGTFRWTSNLRKIAI